MYVNGEMVGRTLIAVTENKGGTTKFNPIKTFKINGKEPPVIIFLEKKCKINIKKDLAIFFVFEKKITNLLKRNITNGHCSARYSVYERTLI